MGTDRKRCRNPDRDRAPYEAARDRRVSSTYLEERKTNREKIQENLRLPGFALPPAIFGINHKQWWRPLAANPFDSQMSQDTKLTGPHHVADRLGDLYEAAIAELRRNGLGSLATGTVDRVRLLNQTFYENVLQRLKYISPDWGSLREDVGKRSLSYGMDMYDEGRRKFLANPTNIPELGDNKPTYTRLWFLVDRWIELTTDGNDILNLDNGIVTVHILCTFTYCQIVESSHFQPSVLSSYTVGLIVTGIGAASAGLGDMNLPSATARFAGLLNHRENAHIGRQAVGLDMASLYDMLVGDVEDRLARENLQLAKRLKQVEGEKQTMRMELDNPRTTHIAYRDRRRSTWMRTLCDIDYAGRVKRFEARKVVFQFLDFVEKKEETVLKEEKSSGLGIRDPIPSIEWK